MKKHKYKSAITERIKRSFHKIGICILVVAFFAPIMAMHGTNAGFLDEEKSEGNKMDTGTLDATILETSFGYTTGSAPMESGDVVTKIINFKNGGSLPFQYRAQYFDMGGGDLCDALLLTAKKGSTVVYNKLPLKDFNTGSVIPPVPPVAANSLILDPNASDNWEFILELPADPGQELENKTCNFDFKFTAWQTDFSSESLGFWDEELIDPGVGTEIESGEWESSGDVVINEIMWMGTIGSKDKDDDEWIELRNTTDEEIDIKNWNIEGAVSGIGGHLEIAGDADDDFIIPAHGLFLITNFKEDKSNINDKIKPDLVKGSLNFDDDYDDNGQVVLKDKTGKIIDQTPVPKDKKWPSGIHGIFFEDGIFHMSMQRQDIPGNGLSNSDWDTCVNANCRSNGYWDDINLFNYGTPKAPNLAPIVMNEFVINPKGNDGASKPNGEWVELYNISNEDFDVDGWYFKNNNGDKKIISKDNTNSGKTIVPASGGRLVIYLEEDFSDNNKGTLSFYSNMGTVGDDSDDVLEDSHSYDGGLLMFEGKTIARFPEGFGIWIDPEATPGEENKMDKAEKKAFQLLAYEKCFDGEKVKKSNEEEVCNPLFLQYLKMIDDLDDEKIDEKTLLDVLEMKEEKKKKELSALVKETEAMVGEQTPLAEEEKQEVAPDTSIEENSGNETKSAENEQETSGGADSTDAADTKIETKEEEIDNTIKNENDGQI